MRERWPEVLVDPELLSAVLQALHLPPLVQANLNDEQRLAVYRLWKVASAITLETIGNGRYRFDYLAQPAEGAPQGTRTAGIIDDSGRITIEQQAPAGEPICPICLAAGTLIETPDGTVAVERLRLGDPIWTLDVDGRRVAGTVIALGSTAAPAGHRVDAPGARGRPLRDRLARAPARRRATPGGDRDRRPRRRQRRRARETDRLHGLATLRHRRLRRDRAYVAGGIPFGDHASRGAALDKLGLGGLPPARRRAHRPLERRSRHAGDGPRQVVEDHAQLPDPLVDVERGVAGPEQVQLVRVVARLQPLDVVEDLLQRAAAVVLAGKEQQRRGDLVDVRRAASARP